MQKIHSEEELKIITSVEEGSESAESDHTRSPSPLPYRPKTIVQTVVPHSEVYGALTMVKKRNGTNQPIKMKKIEDRIGKLVLKEPALGVDIVPVVKQVVSSLCNGITTQELDLVAIKAAANLASVNPDYGKLSSRISVSNMHKQTSSSFLETMKALDENMDNGSPMPLISEQMLELATQKKAEIDDIIDYERDYRLTYFAIATLERSYLLRASSGVYERPQHLFMREALRVGGDEWREYYDRFSMGYFTHATPTMFNAGTCKEQLSSCFLVSVNEDSILGIYNTLRDCALISKGAGGIGIDVCEIRAKGSRISNGGVSSGLVPALQVFEKTANYVDQGGGKRKGAFAMYLEPWHADIFDVVGMKDPQSPESMQALDLFLGMWIPDLFMKRVQESAIHHKEHPTDTSFTNWSLFCPRDVPGLHQAYGDEFENMYVSFESQGLARRKVDAMSLMQRIIQVQTISGGPYMLYKDHVNKLSNQQHLGPIRLSNLCTEIVEYTEPDQEIAVCNLVSIALPRFVIEGELENEFDYKDLGTVVRMAVRSLNRVIDINMYPVESAKNSNLKHRPIGIGVQGLADLFIKLKLPFESEEAIELNRKIFETMYYHAVAESCELAKTHNRYETEQGSPLSKGKFHWQLFEEMTHKPVPLSGMWDWDALRTEVIAHGTRNSLFIAPMPTASTAQILGNSEGLEANQSMIFTRNVLSGEFQVVNTELITHLIKSNQWNEEMRRRLIQNGGSIQNLPVDNETKQLFKTAWEIKQKRVIDMAAARAPFIDQSASLNIYNRNPDPNTMFNIHMYAWKNHLKTGMYYLRSQPGSHANRSVVGSTTDSTTDSTIDSAMNTSPTDNSDNKSNNKNEDQVCRKVEGCLMCGS